MEPSASPPDMRDLDPPSLPSLLPNSAAGGQSTSGNNGGGGRAISPLDSTYRGAAGRSARTASNSYHCRDNSMGTEYYEQMSREEKCGGLVFSHRQMQAIFYNKYVIFVGDSVIRGFYKDFIIFLQSDRHMTKNELRNKGEATCAGDQMVFCPVKRNGPPYKEVRQYLTPGYRVEFYFTTRAYNDSMDGLFEVLEKEEAIKPDFIIMNACLWDLTRYDGEGHPGMSRSEIENLSVKQYMTNLIYVCERLKQILPPDAMFLWLCTLPLSSKIGAGFMNENVQYKSDSLRLGIMEANFHAAQLMASFGFDVLDLHYYMRPLIKCRERDGVHWNAAACRHVNNLILGFVMDAMGEPLPKETVDFIKRQLPVHEQNDVQAFQNLENFRNDRFPEWTANLQQMFSPATDLEFVKESVASEKLAGALPRDRDANSNR